MEIQRYIAILYKLIFFRSLFGALFYQNNPEKEKREARAELQRWERRDSKTEKSVVSMSFSFLVTAATEVVDLSQDASARIGTILPEADQIGARLVEDLDQEVRQWRLRSS